LVLVSAHLNTACIINPHQRDKLDPDPHPHQFPDDNPKCMENEHVFQGFEPLFGSLDQS
jgi:hypothetical protein